MTNVYIVTNGHDIGGVFSRIEFAESAASSLGNGYRVLAWPLNTATGLRGYVVILNKKGSVLRVYNAGDVRMLGPVQVTTGGATHIVFAENEEAAAEQVSQLDSGRTG